MGIFNLHGRVVVVTGGTAGLGRGIAIALTQQDANPVILTRRPDKLTETAREIGSLGRRCLPVACDISDEASVQNAVETVVNHYKKVDILVNNAGNGEPFIPAVGVPQEIFDKAANLDLCSLFWVMKVFGKVMMKAGYGRIINIAFAMGMVGDPGVPLAGYQAAKGGVVNLTRAAAAEWATQGMTVNNTRSGMFPSESNGADLTEESQTFIKRMAPMQRAGTSTDLNIVGDIGVAVVFLVSEESRYITGIILSCDGGWTCVQLEDRQSKQELDILF